MLPQLAGDDESPTSEAPLVFHAIGMAEWHFATRHCPRCGGRLESRLAGAELVCVECGKAQFPRTDPAVIMAITHGEPGSADEALLLGRQSSWPEGRYSTLAGFLEPGETLEDAVRREVLEEVGVRVGEVTYFGNQPWPLPASLMLGFLGARRDPRHHGRRQGDRGRPLVHPRARCRTRPRPAPSCCPAASRSAAPWSSTGTAVRSPGSW